MTTLSNAGRDAAPTWMPWRAASAASLASARGEKSTAATAQPLRASHTASEAGRRRAYQGLRAVHEIASQGVCDEHPQGSSCRGRPLFGCLNTSGFRRSN